MGDKQRKAITEEKAQEQAEEKRDLQRKQDLEDVKTLLGTGPGRRFLRRLFRENYLFRTTFTGNSQGMFLEGHRNVALRYFSDLVEVAPQTPIGALILDEEEKEDA